MIPAIKSAIFTGCLGLTGTFFLSSCATTPRRTEIKPADVTEFLDEWKEARSTQEKAELDPRKAKLMADYLRQLDAYKNATTEEKIQAVYRITAGWASYNADTDTYGKEEYWASPYETISKRRGDCEDLAILKYHALCYLGIPEERMCLAISDLDGDDVVDHCVLIVFLNDKKWIVFSNNDKPYEYSQANTRARVLFNDRMIRVYTQQEGVWAFRDFDPGEPDPGIRAAIIGAPHP